MSIDLSKAKLGDKFRTRIGEVVTYKRADDYIAKTRSDYHVCDRPDDSELTYFNNGKFIFYEEHPYDLVEQVLDKPLDELIEEGTKQIKKNDDAIKEEQELQRRQEVVELAEKLVVNEEMMKAHKDLFEAEVYAHAKIQTTYPAFVIRIAEYFIKHKNQYLKDGKL